MILAVIGLKCSGKSTFAQFLVQKHDYLLIDNNLNEEIEEQITMNRLFINDSPPDLEKSQKQLTFDENTEISIKLFSSEKLKFSTDTHKLVDSQINTIHEMNPIMSKSSKKNRLKAKIKDFNKIKDSKD